jgi:hypothetical protein
VKRHLALSCFSRHLLPFCPTIRNHGHYLYANNHKRGTYCCVSVTRIVRRMCHSVTLYVCCIIMLLLPVVSVSVYFSFIPNMKVAFWDTIMFQYRVITQMSVSRALLLFIVHNNRHKFCFISLCSTVAIYLQFISAGHIWVPYKHSSYVKSFLPLNVTIL